MKLCCLLAVACVVSGCSYFERISECRELARTVNEHMDELEAAARGKETPETFARLARGYGKLADEVAAMPVARGAASAAVSEYVTLLRSAAKSSGQAEKALEAGQIPDAPRRELDRISRKEKMTVQKLEAYCKAP